MATFVDRTDKRYGKLVARSLQGKNERGILLWLCVCDCGTTKVINGDNLGATNGTKSCGCTRAISNLGKTRSEEAKRKMSLSHTTHGKSKTLEFVLFNSARWRAKRKGIPFELTMDDILIPSKCPVLDIPLVKAMGLRGGKENSPTVDRIRNEGGYTKDNFWIISKKANTMKSNASLEELKLLIGALERKLS